MASILTHNLGFPRIGLNRELKLATEKFWQGKITQDELVQVGKQLRKQNWLLQQEKGIHIIPSNDFSFYDQTLDAISLYGAVPKRYGWKGGVVNFDTYFAMARGIQEKEADKQKEEQAYALEMLKWFDTNYHYMVPEFSEDTEFNIASTKVFDEFQEALELGIKTKPVLIGPLTFLHLGKSKGQFDRFSLLSKLLPVFIQVLQKLASLGAEWIQIDEPALIFDLSQEEKDLYAQVYKQVRAAIPSVKIVLATYFEDLGDRDAAFNLPVDALHVDVTRGAIDIENFAHQFQSSGIKYLSVGAVDGRNIWKSHFRSALQTIKPAVHILGRERVMIAPSCSLIHVPITVQGEKKLQPEVLPVLSFATEKLEEVVLLSRFVENLEAEVVISENEDTWKNFLAHEKLNNESVRTRIQRLKPEDFKRKNPFPIRREKQRLEHDLPLFPTTSIGSLPQTADTRAMRLKFKKGEITEEEYDQFIKKKINEGIQLQEELGIDLIVHGEFERNDMVEYFGEQLDGFTFTSNGWVQSFGSRYVKPPIIYGDVARPKPMTLPYTTYAKSVSKKPVKGMLTGPITILQWSFVRTDQPRSTTAFQIALAIRDEVTDLEKAGIDFIQVDEPALREGLPLHKSKWEQYLKWAGDAFRLSVSSVEDKTQIHTHMCYCEFADVIESIAELDADVISIESSRSQMKLLGTFGEYHYPNEIGPGVFDIHSPRIPSVSEIVELLKEASRVISPKQLWVNPDCGLKTRQYNEVRQSLDHMVKAAIILRQSQTEKK